MEGSFGFPFGGDPEDLLRGLREFPEAVALVSAARQGFMRER